MSSPPHMWTCSSPPGGIRSRSWTMNRIKPMAGRTSGRTGAALVEISQTVGRFRSAPRWCFDEPLILLVAISFNNHSGPPVRGGILAEGVKYFPPPLVDDLLWKPFWIGSRHAFDDHTNIAFRFARATRQGA